MRLLVELHHGTVNRVLVCGHYDEWEQQGSGSKEYRGIALIKVL